MIIVGGDDVAMQGDGTTALIVASGSGHADVVATLLMSGAAVNQGRTVSMFWRGNDDRIRLWCLVGRVEGWSK